MKFLPAPEVPALTLPAPLLLGLGVALLVTLFALHARLRTRRTHRTRTASYRMPARPPPPADRFCGSAQYRAALACSYERVPLLNGSEMRLLPAFEAVVRNHGQGARLVLQVPLGEVLRPVAVSGRPEAAKAGFHAINAKRVDFAVVDARGLLLAAVEYQGSGHALADPWFRDGVKRAALARAGVALVEVAADEPPEAAAARLAAVLRQGTAPPMAPPAANVTPLVPRR